MKISIEVSNLTKKRINPDLVKKVVRKTLKLSGAKSDMFEISVVFVGGAEMRKINRKYRKKNKPTDVLSFCLDLGYNKKGIKRADVKNYIGGEIILCPKVIAKNAREGKTAFSRELGFVLSHGVLHVLGWKHSIKMYALQDEISAKLKNQNVK